MRSKKQPPLSELEHILMTAIWESGSSTAEQCRETLPADRPLKDSTVRTVLRRLEAKGYLKHSVEGRAYVYRPAVPATRAAAQAVRRIMERFCGGSLEELLVGMVDNSVADPEELRRIAGEISRTRKESK